MAPARRTPAKAARRFRRTGRLSSRPDLQTLILSLEQLSFGALLAIAPLALRQLPGGFPSLIAHVAAVLWGVAGVAALRLPPGHGRDAAPILFALGVASLVYARVSLWGRHGLARAFLALLLALGAWVLFADAARIASRLPGELSPALIAASVLASAFVLGSALSTMILGHWYLIPPPLPFTHLIRGAVIFVVACVLRSAVSIASVAYLSAASAVAHPGVRASLERLFRVEGDLIFVLLRFFWGILGPIVLSILVLRTARLHSNQSATGLLYVAVVFVLIGELLANFLLVESSLPL